MKQICLGTIINLIYQSRARSADTIKSVCGGIFAAYGLDINTYNKELPSHLKSGHDPTPVELISVARTKNIDDVAKGIEDYLIPLIHQDKHELLFLALKEVLREDISIDSTTVVGVTPGFEKDNILNQNSFYKAITLANLITYAITNTENNKLKPAIREIGKDYVDGFKNSTERVYFLSQKSDNDQISPLKRTIKDPMFNRIFLKATDMTISALSNNSKASVFYLDPSNCQFRFMGLKDFIINNIGSYVFSRAQIKRIYDRTKNQTAIGSQAMLKFITTYGVNSESVLGEILLYIFMEQELDAPKIMSKIEINKSNRNSVSKSDGVYLLSTEITGQPFYQLVFGASNIVGDIKVAVDRAFDKIVAVKNNRDSELQMVDNTTQWTIYDPDTTDYMVKLLTPQRNGIYKPDMAFGAFLGYTIKLNQPETDSQKYRIAVKEQLKQDITNIQPYIVKKILDNRLAGYSFYFYLLPFNDATNERTSIIRELLLGGGI